jgi:hypothetical protein
MDDSLKKVLLKLAAFVVAVLIIILGLTINFDTIKSWVSDTRIIVSSKTRGVQTEYLAGEVLRLSVDGIQSPRVVWVFDENQTVLGGVEAQYAFTYDPKAPSGQAVDHRIDAFYKTGDRYRPASVLLRTRNDNFKASLGVRGSDVVVTAPTEWGADWALTGASLTLFSDGQFTKRAQFTRTIPRSGDDAGQGETPNHSFILTGKETQEAFGWAKTTDLSSGLSTDRRAWTQYEFRNKTTGASLAIAKPLYTAPQNPKE